MVPGLWYDEDEVEVSLNGRGEIRSTEHQRGETR